MSTTAKKKSKYEIGTNVEVPIHLSSGTITVTCVIVDDRQVFGRHEVEVSPLAGGGLAWVRVDRLEDGTGPTNRSKTWQLTHNGPPSGTQVPHP
jgi:hypothetical protein